MKRSWPWLAAIVSGAMLALSFAPFDVAAMAGLGLVPLLLAVWLGGRRAKRPGWAGFGLGYLAGASFWLINLKWIAEVSVVGMFAVSLFLAGYFALWGAFAAGAGNPWREGSEVRGRESEAGGRRTEVGVAAKVRERGDAAGTGRKSGRVLGFAALNALWWCGLEWVRGWFLTGFGWNGLGVAFHDLPVLAQCADLIGATGLSFLPVYVMAVVVQVGRGLHQEVRSGKLRAHWDFGIAMAVAALFFLYGVWKLRGESAGETVPLHVLLVQLNIPQEASHKTWEPHEIHLAYEQDTLEALEALEARNAERAEAALQSGTSEAVKLDVPDWIVWPESALAEYLPYSADGRQGIGLRTKNTMRTISEAGRFTILFGLNEVESDFSVVETIPPLADGRHFNSLLALSPGEDEFRTYRKQHLVLFGETIPYREQLRVLEWLWEQSAGTTYGGSFAAGEGDEPLRLPFSRMKGGEIAVIPTICFEDTVPRQMRKFARNGGQVIVNLTNDGWFKQSEAAAQHFANAKFRSIELRRPTVRCANTGVSAVIGADGRVVDPETGERRLLVDGADSHLTRGWLYATAHVPVDGPLTVYARFGDWFAVLGFIVGLGWWVLKRYKSQDTRAKSQDTRRGARSEEQVARRAVKSLDS